MPSTQPPLNVTTTPNTTVTIRGYVGYTTDRSWPTSKLYACEYLRDGREIWRQILPLVVVETLITDGTAAGNWCDGVEDSTTPMSDNDLARWQHRVV